MKKDQTKKVAVITGASSGIGKATALYFADRGFIVYGLSRRKIDSDKFVSIVCDVTDSNAVDTAFDTIFQKEKRIDVLINNAGVGVSGAMEYIDKTENQKVMDVNVVAVMDCCKLIVPYMKENNCGTIINVSSVAGVVPIPFQATYSASKAAINSFSYALRLELAPFNIGVCVVMPGDTKTDFTANRVKVEQENDYNNRITESVVKMEKDEQKGTNPEKVAKVFYKLATRKRKKAVTTVGFAYKTVVFLAKILPNRFMLFVINKLYG